ncbi:hypothetical protein CLOM_g10260 [Closterium sp. NIES-68]|nr:hypothetical protein CLOM_g10260 [Closterium sp. NIES-68]GJP85012.1 hypothetical protein CLOP_g15049 [Closterium sp. NIES-67]
MKVARPPSRGSAHPSPSSAMHSAIDCSSPDRESQSCSHSSPALAGSSPAAASARTAQHRTSMTSSLAMSPASEPRASESPVDSPAAHRAATPAAASCADSFRRPHHFLKRSDRCTSPCSPSPPSAKRACKRRLFGESVEAAARDEGARSASMARDDPETVAGVVREEYWRHLTLLRPLPSPLLLGLSCMDAARRDDSSSPREGAWSPCSSAVDSECAQVPTPGPHEGALSSPWDAGATTPPTSPRPQGPPVCPGAPMKAPPLALIRQMPSAALHRIMRPLFL